MRAFRLGVTGGIGSGKSTVAALCAEQGAVHIDADNIARMLTAAGGTAIPAIRAAFGNDMLDTQGALNRARMRALVFADETARHRLEAIVHPLVGQAITSAMSHAQRNGYSLMVLDIPLLTESHHWLRQLDAVLVVDCLEETQITRVAKRSGLSPGTVRAIMANQNSRATRRDAADMVLYNEGITLAQLRSRVQCLLTNFA